MQGFDRIVPLFQSLDTPNTALTNQPILQPICDLNGILYNLNVVNVGGGAVLVQNGRVPSADALLPAAFACADTASISYGFDGATFDRLRTVPDNANGQAALGIGTLAVISRLQAVNQISGNYDRLSMHGTDSDAQAAVNTGALMVDAHGRLFNGTSFDRARNNVEGTALASAIRGATNNSADLTSHNGSGINLFLDITAVPGVVTVTPSLEAKDPVSGKYATVATWAAQSAIGTYILGWYNSATLITNTLPRTWRVKLTHSGVGNFTYSVGYCLSTI